MGQMETPCVNICVIDQVTRLCAGCFRSLDEIARWRSYSDAERARIMAQLPARRPQVRAEVSQISKAGP